MKPWLAGLFLFIFSFQVLPVKELGELLFKSVLTEEVQHDCTETNVEVKKLTEPFVHPSTYWTGRSSRCAKHAALAIHRFDNLPDYHVPDILTPPPNCHS